MCNIYVTCVTCVTYVTCVDIPERTVGVEVGPLHCPRRHKKATVMNELYEGLFVVYLLVIASS